jgi:hypothetical protein
VRRGSDANEKAGGYHSYRLMWAWIRTPESSPGRATPDPIRTRMSFLHQLTRMADRVAFLCRADALTAEAAIKMRALAEAERAERASDGLAAFGALHQPRHG